MSARLRLARPSAGSAADRPVVESILAREASLIAHTDVDPKGLSERIRAGRRRPVLDVIARARFDGNRLRRSAELEKQVGLRRVLGTGGHDEGRAHEQHRDTRGRSRCVHADSPYPCRVYAGEPWPSPTHGGRWTFSISAAPWSAGRRRESPQHSSAQDLVSRTRWWAARQALHAKRTAGAGPCPPVRCRRPLPRYGDDLLAASGRVSAAFVTSGRRGLDQGATAVSFRRSGPATRYHTDVARLWGSMAVDLAGRSGRKQWLRTTIYVARRRVQGRPQ
jgi:hypothetical protein